MKNKTNLDIAIMYHKKGKKDLTTLYLHRAMESNEEIVKNQMLYGFIRDILTACDSKDEGNKEFFKRSMQELEKIVREYKAEIERKNKEKQEKEERKKTGIALGKIRHAKWFVKQEKQKKRLNTLLFILVVLLAIFFIKFILRLL